MAYTVQLHGAMYFMTMCSGCHTSPHPSEIWDTLYWAQQNNPTPHSTSTWALRDKRKRDVPCCMTWKLRWQPAGNMLLSVTWGMREASTQCSFQVCAHILSRSMHIYGQLPESLGSTAVLRLSLLLTLDSLLQYSWIPLYVLSDFFLANLPAYFDLLGV